MKKRKTNKLTEMHTAITLIDNPRHDIGLSARHWSPAAAEQPPAMLPDAAAAVACGRNQCRQSPRSGQSPPSPNHRIPHRRWAPGRPCLPNPVEKRRAPSVPCTASVLCKFSTISRAPIVCATTAAAAAVDAAEMPDASW